MKALTFPQPVATLVALGIITMEPSLWSTDYRGPLALHAATVYPQWAKDRAQQEPFRTLLGQAGFRHWIDLPTGAVIAVCQLTDCRLIVAPPEGREIVWSPYTLEQYAWHFAHVRSLPKPIRAAGGWGLWEWDVPPDLADLFETGTWDAQLADTGIARIRKAYNEKQNLASLQ